MYTASNWPSAQLSEVQQLEQKTFVAVNRIRHDHGLVTLSLDEALNDAARRHTQDMAERHYMNHVNPDGYSIADRARLAGIRRTRRIAENLGRHRAASDDPVADIVNAWMKSPDHRKNILNPRFKHTGLGVVRTLDGTLYFTQLFADRP